MTQAIKVLDKGFVMLRDSMPARPALFGSSFGTRPTPQGLGVGDQRVEEAARMQAQSTTNKQGSGEALPPEKVYVLRSAIEQHSKESYGAYEEMLQAGLTRELARMVLPTNFYTEWYWTTDLHNLMGFLRQRLDMHAQYEIRCYAKALLKLAQPIAPYTLQLFVDNPPEGSIYDL